jgi:hypothetical protein
MKETFVLAIMVVASLSPAGSSNGQLSQQPTKEQIIEELGLLPSAQATSDNSRGAPLRIQAVSARDISADEFKTLTGENAAHSRQTTFPDVTLLNASSMTIRSFAIAVISAADNPNNGYALLKDKLAITPGSTNEVASGEWVKLEKMTIKKGDKFVNVLRTPGIDSAKSWLPGAASDLKVVVLMVEFEDGEEWRIPPGSVW